jgi:hypothetical protein
MFTTMKNIFRLPLSPFQLLNHSPQPIISEATPSGGTSVRDSPSILRENRGIQGLDDFKEAARESDIDECGEVNGSDPEVYESNGNGMPFSLNESSKLAIDSDGEAGMDLEQLSESSKEPAIVQHTLGGDQEEANDSTDALFVYDTGLDASKDRFTALLTPTPGTYNRNQHSPDRADEHGETTSKKRKRSRESTMPHSEKKSRKSSSRKHNRKSRKSDPSSSPPLSRQSTIDGAKKSEIHGPSKREKEEKRRLKRERKLERKRKKERQTSETGSQTQPGVTRSLRNETFRDSDNKDAEVSPPSPVAVPDPYRIFEFHEQSPEPPPKRSAKKGRRHKHQVPASVEPQSQVNGDYDLKLESPSSQHWFPNPNKESIKKREDNANADLSADETRSPSISPASPVQYGPGTAIFASQEIPEYRSTNPSDSRHVSSSPPRRRSKPQRRKKYLSLERIIDSSADEKDEEEIAPKRRKIQDLENLRTPYAGTANQITDEESNEDKKPKRRFTAEEDKRHMRIVTEYKEVIHR